MIQVGTYLKIIDNSGGREAVCIGVLAGFQQRYSKIGEIITVSIKRLRTRRRSFSKVKKGEILKAILVRTNTLNQNKSINTNFLENSILLLNKQNKLIGTRIFGALSITLRYTKHLRLTFLAVGTIY